MAEGYWTAPRTSHKRQRFARGAGMLRRRPLSARESDSSSESASTSSHGVESTTTTTEAQANLLTALAAGLSWGAALTLLLLVNMRMDAPPFSLQWVLFSILVMMAGLLTFAPLERRTELPFLTLEGAGGSFLLLYLLAFVPPPTGWLLSLPDLPIYFLFLLALFWSASAVVMPFFWGISQALFHQRARQMDCGRVQRQAHEVGILVAGVAALGALRVLTPVSFVLFLLIVITAELLCLSRITSAINHERR